MAKNKTKQELTYLQMPLPNATTAKKMLRVNWSGLNKRYTLDTGDLSAERNISTKEAPYLTPSEKRVVHKSGYKNPIGLFGFDDFLLCIYRTDTDIKIDYITADEKTYTGVIKSGDASNEDDYPRCVVQFNLYDTPTDVLGGSYDKKLLIFPDCMAMPFEINSEATDKNGDNVVDKDGCFTPKTIINMPKINYACVHLSRVFGVDDSRIYASGYNDYLNWNFDTAEESLANNAWCSPAQSNTKANGDFTGITVFQNHIICFKRDFMHELYNNKNPFRIQDIFAEGTVDNRTVQDVDGKLIFVSDDNVKIYTGSNPRDIGHNLNVDKFDNAVAGTDGRRYFLYCKTGDGIPHTFVYDTLCSQWSEEEATSEVISFAHNKCGMYALCDDGCIYRLDSGIYSHKWSFETDITINQSIDIKHIDKIQVLARMSDNSMLRIYALYDDEKFDEKTSHLLCTRKGSGRKAIRVKLRNTASYGFKLHFEGYGYIKLYQLEIIMSDGGILYV